MRGCIYPVCEVMYIKICEVVSLKYARSCSLKYARSYALKYARSHLPTRLHHLLQLENTEPIYTILPNLNLSNGFISIPFSLSNLNVFLIQNRD